MSSGSAGTSGGGGGGGSFNAFFEGWMVRHEHYLEELLSVQQRNESQEDDLKDLIKRVLSHYQQYFEEKARLAQRNVFLVFSPTWFTSLECATLWITGFKPGYALRLVSESVQDLSREQSQRLRLLMEETRVEERVLNEELARVQETLAAPPLLEMVRKRARRMDAAEGVREEAAALATLRKALEEVVAGADLLRMSITLKVAEILKPEQNVRFLTGATRMFLELRNLGLQKVCPSSAGTVADALHKTHWVRQDKLILSAILASTSSSITPFIATAKTSHEVWKKLKNLYASRSRTRAMQLKEELTLIQRGNWPITEYLHSVKALADEIAIIDHSISDDDLTLYVLNGLGPYFREITAPIRARESSLAFEELYDLLVGHETYLRCMEAATHQLVSSANFMKTKQSTQGGNQSWSFKKNDAARGTQGFIPGCNNHGAQRDGRRSNNNSGKPSNSNRRYQPKCQLCDQLGHIAKYCPKFNSQNVSINCATSSNRKDKNWLLDSTASYNITGDLSNLSIHSEYDGTDEDKMTGAILLKGACDNGIYTFPDSMVTSKKQPAVPSCASAPSHLTEGPPAIITSSQSSKKQRVVTRSSTEVEYRTLANAASETMWLSTLFKELFFPIKESPQLLCDKLGATHLSFNLVNHSRIKHIQIDLHFVRDLVQKGSLQVKHVHTQDQLVDLLTKPLSKPRTELLRNKIGLADGSSILRGRIRETCDDSNQTKTDHV
ncbi:Acyl-CoA oxidase 4 [Hibiscus syriacus]|uniref:Acyl-CoA oxidase 4 n=1 Tax=Hibiscus syriacus TaxID=106335 RepID=A0A6A2Z5H7_HIBSY|nr:Acyl-CoA oxidase 4 [Hibiscus syriacus]